MNGFFIYFLIIIFSVQIIYLNFKYIIILQGYKKLFYKRFYTILGKI